MLPHHQVMTQILSTVPTLHRVQSSTPPHQMPHVVSQSSYNEIPFTQRVPVVLCEWPITAASAQTQNSLVITSLMILRNVCVGLSVCMCRSYVGMGTWQGGQGRAFFTNAGSVGCSHGPANCTCTRTFELRRSSLLCSRV